MASIKKIQAKGYRRIGGAGDLGFAMSLYLGNTRIARCLNDGRGGMTNVVWDGAEFRAAASELIAQYYIERPRYTSCDGEIQDFINELQVLCELQEMYKKGLKKGYVALIRILYNTRTTPPQEYNFEKQDIILQSRKWNKEEEEKIGLESQPIEMEVYTSLEAFDLQ